MLEDGYQNPIMNFYGEEYLIIIIKQWNQLAG